MNANRHDMTGTGQVVTLQQVKLLLREGEGLTVEFKERYTPRIDEDIVALANSRGGTLLLGVRDDGTIVGERLTNDLKAKINSLARNCKPALAVDLSQVGEVVAIVVPEGMEKPYSCGTGYYRRLDATTQKMSHDELRIMFAEHEPLPFEERTVRGCTFNDISKTKIRAFLKEAGIRIGGIAVPEFLRSLKVADEARVKNAGILFFAKDVYEHLHQAQMTLLAFKGPDRLHIYDRRDVRDDLLTQFNEAVAFLKKHLNIRSEIRGVDREDIYEIPLEVLREALVNALMHRDYSITGTQVSVEVYDDRVEIVNPGGLPKGLSVRDLGTVSIRRNELIADLFFRLHKVERIGMGIRKMKEAMVAAGLREPTFEPDGFFRAIFHRSPEFALKEGPPGLEKMSEEMTLRLVDKLAEGLVEVLAENQKRLLQLMLRNPRISKKAMAETVGISSTAVDNNLSKLKQLGLLRRVGPDKGGYWEVIR
ncbi:MAG: helix-turn-helix domain-containing protein [Candidatus Methylomirabilis sp.]|nr:helix-turn-helix domain-containing protein [Candidatus Methylomirabilis sp.]